MTGSFTTTEMMIVAGARAVADEDRCFVGVGLPNVAASLARHAYNDDLELVYESGILGARSPRVALSIGDPALVSGSAAVMTMFDLFGSVLQGGRVDVGFLGAAQVDRHGSVNTTVIGPYQTPKVRLPGAGGATEIGAFARRTIIFIRHRLDAFVNELDFCTTPGRTPDLEHRRQSGELGGGPSHIVTDLGVLAFDDAVGEFVLEQVHPCTTPAQVTAATGWDLRVSPELIETPAPTAEELRLLRDVVDPHQVYRR